mmetsp:Transcript_10558/g.25427  ORF Transcript_10558/g.25427 Transcript_10558/m.25427 type:complete len:89 (-) Transcript_10558:248-514(-)
MAISKNLFVFVLFTILTDFVLGDLVASLEGERERARILRVLEESNAFLTSKQTKLATKQAKGVQHQKLTKQLKKSGRLPSTLLDPPAR